MVVAEVVKVMRCTEFTRTETVDKKCCTYLEAKLLLVSTMETLQKLYREHADNTFPFVAAFKESHEENDVDVDDAWLDSEELPRESSEHVWLSGPSSTSLNAVELLSSLL